MNDEDPTAPSWKDYLTTALILLVMGASAGWIFLEFLKWLEMRGL